jgi:uncharacterized protein YbjT (DUF2867 family)
MKVLVVGATGLIGSAIVARLWSEGHEVIAAARRPSPSGPSVRTLRVDFRELAKPEQWRPLLAGVDAVVNCAGVLQDGPGESTAAAHSFGPAVLFEACEHESYGGARTGRWPSPAQRHHLMDAGAIVESR